ncbi:MAG: hypothetical protein M0P64_04005 [Candidatus Pacebacteria bacterium]|jgi:hypothetical protein|nr:hypothetical protein [Candidatus Paceibacterota bacterium]
MAHDAPAPAPDTLIRDVVIVLSFILLVYVSDNIVPVNVDTIASGEAPATMLSFVLGKVPLATIQNFIFSIQNGLAFLGLLFMAGAFWATLKIREIHHHEEEKYKPIKPEVDSLSGAKSIPWQVITNHMNSENPAEWKLAILEADNILDEVLEDMGYKGETVAEKLKGMSRTKIASYDDIWEAHKLRNKIAHGETLDMDLTPKLARDTIAKFENAFKELGYL